MLSNSSGTQESNPLILINNVEVSIEYLLKLKKDISTECLNVYNEYPNELEMINTCLDELDQIAKNMKEEILQKYLDRAASRVVERLSSYLDRNGLQKINYDLDEDKYLENQINDPFVSKLIIEIFEIFEPYKVRIVVVGIYYLQ
jgi:hypothetical protein